MKKIIVIGGLSAGPSAAAKARREDEHADIKLFEKSDNISYATCGIPYALSGVIESRDKLLVVQVSLLEKRFNIDVHLNEEVIEVFPDEHKILTSKGEYEYDKLVFATGAQPIIPPVKNIEKVSNWSACRTLADYDRIMKEGVDPSVNEVIVMGAGLIGVEVAENLAEIGKKVTIIEGKDDVLSIWGKKFTKLAENVLVKNNIKVVTGQFVTDFVEDSGKLTGVKLSNGDFISSDYVIMSVGIKPITSMLTDKGAETIGNGALVVDEEMKTSLPDIYAAGDNVSIKNTITGEDGYFPLGTHSNIGGRVAGINISGNEDTFKGAYGTAIIKVFNYTLARTGLNKEALDKTDIPYASSLIIAGATPGYYPGQKDIIQEIFYNKETGVILGAEAFGEVGVDKRIDVLSTAIYAKLKITELNNLDLAYAPPFSPAKDPVKVSGMIASHSFNEQYDEIDVLELKERLDNNDKFELLDVRFPKEVRNGVIGNAKNIELSTLRNKLDELDKDSEIIIYCAKGLRGYLAYRILKQNGFNNIKNLAGGYMMWSLVS